MATSSSDSLPLTSAEIDALRAKEARGELTLEDTRRFILSVRASFLAAPKAVTKSRNAPKAPPAESVDFI
jgi:hypothetical protein